MKPLMHVRKRGLGPGAPEDNVSGNGLTSGWPPARDIDVLTEASLKPRSPNLGFLEELQVELVA